jgi:glycosyltransferase involved in cell wall biosynthesis
MNKSPFRFFSKFLNSWDTTIFFEKCFFIPDLYITWLPSAVYKGMHIIKEKKIDAILTSSPPESVHIAGLLLSKISDIKWIADFRDLWTTKTITNKPVSPLHSFFIKKIENLIYRNADHIIANTYGNKNTYMHQFKISENKITVIPNGYDHLEVLEDIDITEVDKNKAFSVGYMGYFDKPGFPWKEFLRAIKKMVLLNKNIRLKLHICGHISNKGKDFIEKNNLNNFICAYGVLTHFEAIKIMRESDLLLLFLYETKYSKSIVPHKLYYYLGINKPIMAIAEEDGEVSNIIKKTKTGHVVSATKPDKAITILKNYYQKWEKCGKINYMPNLSEIKNYEFIRLTEKLSKTIANISVNAY